jgi:GNAT superfamily N-acetyltransferase
MVQINPNYWFTRALQLEGVPPQEHWRGIAPFSIARVSKFFGAVTEQDWPSNASDHWPPQEPPGLDSNASALRVHHYYRVRNEDEIKHVVAQGYPVVISVPTYSQWHTTESGVINFPSQNDSAMENHAVTVVGYREDVGYFKFQNSWGVKWGDRGFGWLPYGYFDEFGIEAISISDIEASYKPQYLSTSSNGYSECGWASPTPCRSPIHGRSIFNNGLKHHVAWAFGYVEKESIDIEEFFVFPTYRKLGFGRRLFGMLNEFAMKESKKLKFWLPRIDRVLLGQDLHDVAWTFGLRVIDSPVKWADKCLIQR